MMMLALTQVIFSLATVVSGMARPQTLWTETIQEKLSLRRVFLLSWFCMRYSKLWILSWEHLFFCCAKQALIATTPWLHEEPGWLRRGRLYVRSLQPQSVTSWHWSEERLIMLCSQISSPAIEQSIFPVIKRVNMENHPIVDDMYYPLVIKHGNRFIPSNY